MINPLTNSPLRAAVAASVALALLSIATSAHAQQRYGKTPPHFRTAAKKIQLPRVPRLTSPSPDPELRTKQSRYKIQSQEPAVERVQYEAPSVDLPTPAFEANTVVPPASEVFVPAVEGAVPSYEAPIPGGSVLNSDQIYSQNPSDYPLAEGEILVETTPYEQFVEPQQVVPQQVATQPAANQQAPIYSTGTWFMNGNWYGQADVVWLQRDTATEAFLVQDISVGNLGVYRLDDLVSLDYAPGTRVTLGRMLGRDAGNRDHGIDFTFLGGFGWESGNTIVSRDTGGLSSLVNSTVDQGGGTPLTTEALFDADVYRLNYATQFNSFELNYRIRTRPGNDALAMQPDGRWVRHGVGSQMRSLLGGIRFMSMSEDFRSVTTAAGPQTTTTTDFITDGVASATVNGDEVNDLIRGIHTVNTDNDMLGFQLGAELMEKHDEFSWGLRGKVGGFLNFAGRQSRLLSSIPETVTTMVQATNDNGEPMFVDDLGGITSDDGDGAFEPALDTVITTSQVFDNREIGDARDEEQIAFLAEVGLFGTYQIRPNFHFRAGYDLMLLSGVAVAPKNLRLINGFSELNSSSTAFMHGGSFGFETTW